MIGGLNDRVFFRVRAKAFFEPFARNINSITARTSALTAIFHAARRSVVTGRNNAFIFHNHCRDFALNAVRTKSDDFRDSEKIAVPIRTALFFRKI